MQETEMDFREETKLQVGIEINEECSDFFRKLPKPTQSGSHIT